MHPSSSVHQEDSSLDCEIKTFEAETTREMEQGKRLPVVTVDYNYGLPLDYGPEEEERTPYDVPPRDYYSWNWIKERHCFLSLSLHQSVLLYVGQGSLVGFGFFYMLGKCKLQ